MKRLTIALALLLGIVLVGASVSSRAEDTPDALMQAGLDALYAEGDPAVAAAAFRKVLALNPNHYGATYQLATALDRAGKRDEARPLWEKVLKMAEGYKDQPTADTARARLATQP